MRRLLRGAASMKMRESPGGIALSGFLLCGVWALELARLVHDSSWARLVASAFLGLFALLAWFRASAHIRILFMVVAAVAAAGAWAQGSIKPIANGISNALAFGSFFPAMLMLRATVEKSPRLALLRSSLLSLDPGATEIVTLQASHALGSVINVGATAVLAPLVGAGANEVRRAHLAATSARGIGLAAMWSPFYLSVAFTTQLAPGVAMWQVMAIGAGASLLGLALSHVVFALNGSALAPSLARLRPIAVPSAIVIGLVVGCTLVFGWSGLHSVAVAVPILCFAYLTVVGRHSMVSVVRHTLTSAGRVSDEILIVLGGTILGSVIAALAVVQKMGADVTPDMVSGAGAIGGLVVALLALGLIGLHPMILVSVLVPVLCVGNFGICGVVAVATGVFAWGLNATFSIWAMPMAMSASSFGVPVIQLVTRRGVVYLLVYGTLGVVYLAIVNDALRAIGCS